MSFTGVVGGTGVVETDGVAFAAVGVGDVQPDKAATITIAKTAIIGRIMNLLDGIIIACNCICYT
jgi:hypothetical protein